MNNEFPKEYLGGMRKDTLKIEEIAMEMALLISKQSKDPSTQVGACIVKDNRIISLGCNNAPKRWTNDFPWGKEVEKIGQENTKYPYVIHAEMNAILNCKESVEGSTIYVTLFPCSNCSKLIAVSGIKKVIYSDSKGNIDEICSKRLLENCGIEYININDLNKRKVLKLGGINHENR